VIDEIEVLRLFRDEMPGPSTDAWARARSAVAAARSEEEPARPPCSWPPRSRGPGRWRLLSVAGVAAAVGGLLALVLPASPVTRAPGDASVQRARETAYVVSRVAQALSARAQHNFVGYARTELPPGSVVAARAGHVQVTLGSGAGPRQSAGSVVSWSYRGTGKITEYTATGRRVLDEKITTGAAGARVSVGVNYRDGTWWRTVAGPPPGPPVPPRPSAPVRCGTDGRDAAVGSGDWAALIHAELGCGRYTADGRQRVDGIDAIKIAGRNGLAVLWVDPATYLPVRALLAFAQERPQTDFRWLSPAQASLALLNVLVPASFRQVPAPP
jgi:hypothetical protein